MLGDCGALSGRGALVLLSAISTEEKCHEIQPEAIVRKIHAENS